MCRFEHDATESNSTPTQRNCLTHRSLGLNQGKQKNRYFPTKAVAIWHPLTDDKSHVHRVERYLEEARNFRSVCNLDRSPRRLSPDSLYAVAGRASQDQTGHAISSQWQRALVFLSLYTQRALRPTRR
jgi:hypothetical protein